MTQYGVILFYSTSAALRGEKTLKSAGFTCKLIPVPRELSSECGLALRFEWTQREPVEAAIRGARIEVAGIHALS